jgi:hypothetical protein
LGNLILAYFAQDGQADQANDRKVCIAVWLVNLVLFPSIFTLILVYDMLILL